MAKIPLFVSGNNGNLVINEIGTDEKGGATNNQANNMNELTFIMSQMRELRRQNDDLKTDHKAFKVATSSLLRHINASLHKIFAALAVRRINNQINQFKQINQRQMFKNFFY